MSNEVEKQPRKKRSVQERLAMRLRAKATAFNAAQDAYNAAVKQAEESGLSVSFDHTAHPKIIITEIVLNKQF